MADSLKIAVTAWAPAGPWSADQLCRQAEAAEAMGFHSFWLPENHFGDQRAIPSPLTLLAAVAARTSRIKLGSISYLLPIRHPIQAAEEVAVLDQLCGGRLILGIGRGIQAPVFQAFNIDSKDKRRLFQRNLEIMRSAWRGEPIPGLAEDKPAILAPLPLQRPHPPLWVAAFGPLALKQVAQLGLPYLASPMEPLATLADNYARYHGEVAAAGHEPVTTVPIMRSIFISDDLQLQNEVKAALARALPPQLRDAGRSVDDWAIIGDRAYAKDRLGEASETLGVTHLIAGGRLSRIEEREQMRSYEALLALAEELPSHRNS